MREIDLYRIEAIRIVDRLNVRFLVLSLLLIFALINLGGSQPISVIPELPSAAQNYGDSQITISWNYPYNYTLQGYELLIISDSTKDIVARVPYALIDEIRGQHKAISDKYVWTVPAGTPVGRYYAELQIKAKEAGGNVFDKIARAFEITHDTGRLIIFKFEDIERNGIYNEGSDRGLRGWEFQLSPTPGEKYIRVTGEDGRVLVPDLPVGRYTVTELGKEGWRATTETTRVVEIRKDQISDVIFGNAAVPSTLRIVKFEDLNRSGLQDEGEQGLSGWEFSVQGPTSFTASTDKGVLEREVQAGSYRARETFKPGWQAITPAEQSITLAQGQRGELRFGNYRIPPAHLRIIKFDDSNGNAKQDPGETGLLGWEFAVEGPEPFTATTTQDGSATREVSPGSYRIMETVKPGWSSTTGAERTVTVKAGEDQVVFFGNRKPQLLMKYDDLNGDSKLSPGEPGLAGWRFNIKGPVTTSRTTDASGQINLNDLPTGSYTVEEELGDQWYNTTPSKRAITVPGDDLYFGNAKYRTLKIIKFNDLDRSGTRGPGEPGLEGWEFQIGGDARPLKTDANGIATYKAKANANYLVSESIGGAWLNSTPSTLKVRIDPARDVTEAIFGNYHLPPPKEAVIEIAAYNDTNLDAKRNPGEKGLPGWSFRISNPKDPLASAEEVAADENGTIEYVCPAEGAYRVEEILPGPWCNTTPLFIDLDVRMGERRKAEFGNHLCAIDRCEYKYTPAKRNLTYRLGDENLIVSKSIDPYVLTQEDHSMTKGAQVNYTIALMARPKIGPADLLLAVDTSGSVIENDPAAIGKISRGIAKFVGMMRGASPNLRIGLVSWDRDIDSSLSPTSNYDEVINATWRMSANSQELTMYHVGMNGSLAALDASPRAEAKRVMVFITDARNEYEPFLKYPDPAKYTIYVLLMGRPQVNETYEMLNDMAKRYNGSLASVETPEQITTALRSLSSTSLRASGGIKGIRVTDSLPTYLRPLNNGSVPARMTRNDDGEEWTTATMEWQIDSLPYGGSWSTTFGTVFCWKLQANVVQPEEVKRVTSEVRYADPATSTERHISLPEGRIWLERDGGAKAAPEKRGLPGFEIWTSIFGLLALAYALRKR
jgi:hypothetical protein